MLTAPSSNTPSQDLNHISGPVSDLLYKQAWHTSIRKGTVIFGPDNPAQSLLFPTSGIVRVQHCIEAGREVVLYRLHANESCALTTACLLAYENYTSLCIAETDVDAMLLPRSTFDELMATSPQFRADVFRAYSKRIANLFTATHDVAHKQFGHGGAHSARRKALH